MPSLLAVAVGGAALVFIALSATMNALFLSSLGRTALEVTVLAVLSLAADVAKSVLPIVVVRAVALRAWGQAAGAALMLGIVVALSLASGTGFAALTRGASAASRDVERMARAGLETELRDTDAQLALMPIGLPVAVLDAELAKSLADRRLGQSKSCTEMTSNALRQFCATHFALSASRASAMARDRLANYRAEIIGKLASGPAATTDNDPQAAAIASALGIDASKLRRHLSIGFAITLELGSIILVLLLTGPAVLHWQDPDTGKAPSPARLPQSSDVVRWRRQQGKFGFGASRDTRHENVR